MTDCFISYAREDKDFVRELNAALKGRGRTTSLDTQDLLPAEGWAGRLEALIRESDNFVFVTSPDSAASVECGREVALALSFHKRIIPIVVRDLDFATLPPAVRSINAISFPGSGLEAGVESLLRAFDTDLVWVRSHSRLETRAAEWQSRGDEPSYLLRGSDLQFAEGWLLQGSGKEVSPTELQSRYIRASRTDAERRRRRTILALVAALIVTTGLAIVAEVNRRKAVEQTRIAWSRQLAADSRSEQDRALDLSSLLAAAAWSVKPTAEARSALLSNLLKKPALRGILRTSDAVSAAAFSPDGKILAANEGNNTIVLWDVARRTRLGAWKLAEDPGRFNGVIFGDGGKTLSGIASVSFSPDGKTLAAAMADNENDDIILWDVQRRKRLGEPLDLGSSVTTVAFSPDGKTLAAGDSDGAVALLWNLGGLEPPLGELLDGHEQGMSRGILSLAFSPDGKTLAAGSEDRTVILWEVSSRQSLGPLAGHEGMVKSIAFSPDGKTLAVAAGDDIILWDIQRRKRLEKPLTAHQVRCIAFHPDGTTLAAGNGDGTVVLWNVARRWTLGEPLVGDLGSPASMAFSPDGKTLAVGYVGSSILLWDVGGMALGEPLVGTGNAVMSVAFSPDGKTLAAGTLGSREEEERTKTVVLWDAAGRRPLGEPLDEYQGASSVTFSPDGKTLAAGIGKSFILWDVARRKPLVAPLPGHESWVESLAFSPDGRTLASGSDDETVILWDVSLRKPVGKPLPERPSHEINTSEMSVAFSPDGKTLASGSGSYGTVILWDVTQRTPRGAPLEALRHGERVFGGVRSIAFSPDGRILAAGRKDGAIDLWDVIRRASLDEPLGRESLSDEDAVDSVSFSPDGKTLASGWGIVQGHIALWDVARRTRLGELKLADGVNSVSFSPDGKTLASGSDKVILWDVDPESWSRRACSIAGRNLTCDEWRRYLADEPYRKLCPDLPGPERCEARQP